MMSTMRYGFLTRTLNDCIMQNRCRISLNKIYYCNYVFGHSHIISLIYLTLITAKTAHLHSSLGT